MKPKTKDWIVLAIVVIVLALVIIYIVLTNINLSQDQETIKIGVTATLTGFGAYWGEDIQKGIDLAVKEVNEEGGINGRYIEIIYEDIGELDLGVAASAAQKFISVDKVDLVITQWAEDNEVVQPIVLKNNIIIVNIASGSRDVPGSSPLVFMIRPTDEVIAKVLVDYILSQEIKNPVMVVEQNPYFESLGDLTNEIWKNKTGKDINKLSVPAMEKDYRTHFAKVKDGDYDTVFIYILEDSAGLAYKTAGELGIDILKIGFTGAADPPVLGIAGDSAEGLVYPDFTPSEPFFIEKFKDEYGHEPVVASDLAYDAIKVIVEAMRNYGTNTEEIKKGLDSLNNFPGASGSITFNEYGERTGKEIVLKVVKDGKGEILEVLK